MAVGDVTISGGFTIPADNTKIDAFITDTMATISGGQIFVLPQINTAKLWIGVRTANLTG